MMNFDEEFKGLLNRRYDFVCSIGSECACARSLKAAGIRCASYPFDWIITAKLSLVGVAQLIANNFEGFLRFENLRVRPESFGRGGAHAVYDDIVQGIVFVHDFSADRPLAECYSDVCAKYDRRIARLYDAISRARSILVVYRSNCDRPTDEAIRSAAKILRAKFPECVLDLLVIGHHDETRMDVSSVGEGMYRVDAPIHPRGSGAFGDEKVNKRIFSCIRISYRSKMKIAFARIGRAMLRLRLLFVFDRQKRHMMRKRLLKDGSN